MNPYIKYCKKCKEAFDIATNFDNCPICRLKEAEGWEEEWKKEELKERLEDDGVHSRPN